MAGRRLSVKEDHGRSPPFTTLRTLRHQQRIIHAVQRIEKQAEAESETGVGPPTPTKWRRRLGLPRTILTKALDGEEFRMLGHEMVDFIADYYYDIETFPVQSQVQPGYLKRLLPESAPKEQEPLEDILNDVHRKIMPGITHWQSPKFFGYYPSNTSTASILGEMLSGTLSVIGFSWITSPAATELEIIVLDWLAKLLQLPDDFLSSSKGGGVIQGTACEAVLVVMLAARKRALMKVSMEQGISESEALGKLVVYTSDQAHSCVTKASQLAGITTDNLRLIPTDASTNYALPPAVLAETVVADTVDGLIPFFLCGVVGSTSSAAVDPLSELGDIAKVHTVGFFLIHNPKAHLTNRLVGVWALVSRRWSICRKRVHLSRVPTISGWRGEGRLFRHESAQMVPYQLRLLYVVGEGPNALGGSSFNKPGVLNKLSDENLVVDFKDWQIPLGRRFRALKLWMVMRMYGTDFLQSYIRTHCELARHFEALVRADLRFEIMARRTFSLVCFRLKPPESDGDNGLTLNGNLVDNLNSGGDLLVTHTMLEGVYTIRFAIGGARTELRHVDAAWKIIQMHASRLLEPSRELKSI